MDEQLRLLERKAASGGLDDKAVFQAARRRAGVVCDLYDLVSFNLLELAWRANYSLSPDVGLFAFIESFRMRGFDVDRGEAGLCIRLRTKVMGAERDFEAIMGLDELLNGWGHHPSGSPKALYDSICEVYDRMGCVLSGQERNSWEYTRNVDSRLVRRSMDCDFLEAAIDVLHEHAFLSVSGEVSAERMPRLFYEVKERFPIALYERAKEVKAICGPDAQFILETDLSEFSESYHPSVSAMRELFWGLYLDALSKEKGYPVLNEDSRLRSLIARGHEGLAPGRDIWPPKRR